MKRFRAILSALSGIFTPAPPSPFLPPQESAFDLGAIANGREGDLETLQIVYQIHGGTDKETILGGNILRTFKQTGGITTGEILDAVVSLLQRQDRMRTPFIIHTKPIIIENLLRRIHATGDNVHGLSNEGIFIVIRSQPSQNCTVLTITQNAVSPLLPWQTWLDALHRLDGFAQAVLLDAVFDYFQGHPMLSFHREHGRDTSKLTTLTDNPDRIAVSRNPGRTARGWGYQESVGSEMWFSDVFWNIAGETTKERLLSGQWPEARMLENGLAHVRVASDCFTEKTDGNLLNLLREIVYKDARQASDEFFANATEAMDLHSKTQAKKFELARQAAERENVLFTERKAKTPVPPTSIPEKPPYDPDFPVSGFGFKLAWMAVATDDVAEVARFLAIRDARWLPWSPAVNMAYAGEAIGVTPAIDGWVLVFGQEALRWHPECAIVAKCSQRFGEAHFFLTHRVSDAHHWSCWKDGKAVRSMTSFDELEQTGEAVGIDEILVLPKFRGEDWVHLDEQDVMRVAGEWSVDPSSLEQREMKESHILIGSLP